MNRRVLRWLRPLAALIVIAILAGKLREIGWSETWASLPAEPAFYVLFALIYLVMPLTDLLIYRGLWRVGPGALPALLRKRVYNELILDYSGEALLCLWAPRHGDVHCGWQFVAGDARDGAGRDVARPRPASPGAAPIDRRANHAGYLVTYRLSWAPSAVIMR